MSEPVLRAPLGQLLLRAFSWFDASLLRTLAARGWPQLTQAQSLVMAHVPPEGTRSSELARRIGVTRQAVHQTIRELAAVGLVRLEVDATNRSAKLVGLTGKGRANVAAALSAFEDLEVALAARLGAAHARALRRALEVAWGEPVTLPHQPRR